jgi:hypothetical protein
VYLLQPVLIYLPILGLTRMTADDMKNHPLESVSTKTPFNDGTVYQIAVPRQSGCWDLSFQQQNGTTIGENKCYLH